MKASEDCLDLIKRFEGFRAQCYRCPAGQPTIGYGHVVHHAENELLTATIDEAAANALLHKDVMWAEQAINIENLELTQPQYDALVSFVFNIGSLAWRFSTLLKLLRAKDYEGAAHEFPRWNKVHGEVMSGLTKRRLAERTLFERGAK